MSIAVPADTRQRKPDARRALESPYQREHEASVETVFAKAPEPKGLPALIGWFREQCANELPETLHKAGVWRDYGPDAAGGSVLGAPAPSDPFRRFLENSPSETDADGFYVRPLRAALSRMSRRWPLTARHLFRLALVQGDWHRHADNEGFQREEMELYLERAVFLLWREFAREGLRLQ